ncbi:RND family efflux transporter, MFP subunit [Andreprevotia lacus DSM 23236]|jgi:RND family efflux transporter MFP subunit|uniref:RND family efflux transporter, MFP subunit n=1 Tax=Andreprevotia lacus DSM 23236 TaxID=1121001 RepID=A0A1W1XHE9_9NEIS|nr:efflux RND transporter periplasmic adaptor subunit [Andreprevotia lacus]SMC23380.1 RND family efflux transporter, MFP subunit [Andreprevotia lacus DSM 23236]
MMMRYKPLHAFLLVLPALSCVALTGCDNAVSAPDAKQESKPALAVSLVAPRTQPWSETISASGTIQAWQQVSIGAEINGVRMVDVLASVGDTVRKGQLLAKLDDAGIRVDLALQRALLDEAQANYAQAQLSYERAKKLDESRAISRQDLLGYETAAKTGAAKLAVAKAQVEGLELKLQYTRIVAPDDGVIAASNASVGAMSDAGGELFKLIRKGRIEWRAELRPEQQARIEVGQDVTLHDPLGQAVQGKVRQLAPTADRDSRSALVYVDVAPSKVLKPGVLVTGEFAIANKPAMTVPQTALVLRDGFNYVMRVDPAQLVKPVKVAVGARRGKDVEITDGLTVNDRVVAQGGAFLQEGDKVSVVDGANAAKDKPASKGKS